MSYQRSPSLGRPPNYGSALSHSTQTVSPFHDVVIPPGTVAARLRYIRSLANTPFSRSPNRRRENSRAGFGRRISNRFAQPASHNDKPDKQPQVEATHSFLGLNTPRRNHEEEHAITDHGARQDRTPGLDGHSQSDGKIYQVQYDNASPWIGKPSKKTKRSRRGYGSLEIDILSEVDTSGSDIHILTETSVFPSLGNEPKNKLNMYRQELKSGQDDTINSKISNKTTSTIRRKSVRDLFEDYGVEIPPGLASSEDTSCQFDNIPMPRQPPHRYCHCCSWINKGSESKCLRCNHPFCKKCDSLSPFLSIRQEAILNVEKLARTFKESSIGEQPAVQEMRQDQPRPPMARPGPTPLQMPKQEPIRTRRTSSPPTKFASYSIERPAAPKSPPKIPPQMLPRQSRVMTEVQTSSGLKSSSFLVADVAADDQRFKLLPATPNEHQHQRHSDKEHHHNRCHSSSSYSHLGECESSDCRSTHHGHTPFRHSITCARSKPRAREETDIGYVADTSHIEDVAPSHSNSGFGRPYSTLTRTSRSISPFSQPKPSSSDLAPAQDLVECNGYPRTGHTQHSSPMTSGIVGECQHCLHDCQCQSCQKTEHRVRCCVHEDHRAMQHQHPFTKEKSAIPTEAQEGSQRESADLTKKSDSSAPTVKTVIPYTPECEIHSTRPSTQTVMTATPQKAVPQSPAPLKKQSLPKSRSSTLVKEPSKLYPSAPWVITSKGKDTVVTPSEIFRRNIADRTLAGTPNPRSIPDYKDMETPYKKHSATDSRQEVDQSHQDRKTSNHYPNSALTLGDQSYVMFKNLPNSVVSPSQHNLPSRRESPSRWEPSSRKEPPSGRELPSQRGSPLPPVSRKLSDLYNLRDESQVPLLTQKLQEHQEELKMIEKLRDERMDNHSLDKFSPLPPDENIRSEDNQTKVTVNEKEEQRPPTFEKKRAWQMRLVDRKPSPSSPSDGDRVVSKHRLGDDALLEESNKDMRYREIGADEHGCIWKQKALNCKGIDCQKEAWEREKEKENSGILGLTITIHFIDREDLVFKTDFKTVEKVRG